MKRRTGVFRNRTQASCGLLFKSQVTQCCLHAGSHSLGTSLPPFGDPLVRDCPDLVLPLAGKKMAALLRVHKFSSSSISI